MTDQPIAIKPLCLPAMTQVQAAGQHAFATSLHGRAWGGRIHIESASEDGRWGSKIPFLLQFSFSGRRFYLGLTQLPFADKLASLSAPCAPLDLPPPVLETLLVGLAAETCEQSLLDDFSFHGMGMNASPPHDCLRQALRLRIDHHPPLPVLAFAPIDFPFAALDKKLTLPAAAKRWPPRLVIALPLLAGRLCLARAVWRELAIGDILFPNQASALPQIVTRPKG